MATRLADYCLVPPMFLVSSSYAVVAPAISSRKAVDRLPGFTVDEVRFFYYFIQSERNPEEDPVLLWLTGGPGCSALSGLVYEIGPLSFDFHGYKGGLPTMLYKPDSWTKVGNIIFVDSPPGTGFSYAIKEQGLNSSDTTIVRQLYRIGSSDDRHLNLKGYIAGNPLTDIPNDDNSRFPFLHGMGIIADELYEAARKSCRGDYNHPENSQCANLMQTIWDCIRDVNEVHILEPRCEELESSIIDNFDSHDGRTKLLESAVSSVCRNATYLLSKIWANNETVRESLGIHKGTVTTWQRCDYGMHDRYKKEIVNTVDYHLSLITQGYRGLIYSGDHDSRISFVGTQGWLRSLNLSITDNWRPWYVNSQVAGFTRTYSNNLTYATVKGAGHTAPEYMPKECLAMATTRENRDGSGSSGGGGEQQSNTDAAIKSPC
uniref:Serine carboxypeptidase-like 18 n=1 Tax=Leersia perrieri TaxID=77586 RepID=A0A0D9W2B8_9ORYZ